MRLQLELLPSRIPTTKLMSRTICKAEKTIVNVLHLHSSALNQNFASTFYTKPRSVTTPPPPLHPSKPKPKLKPKLNLKPNADRQINSCRLLRKVEDFPYWLNYIKTVTREFPGFLVVELYRHGNPGNYTERVVSAHFQCANNPKVNSEINSIIASTVHPKWISSAWKEKSACQNLEDIKLMFSKEINVEFLLKLEKRMEKDPHVTIELLSRMYMMVFQEPPTNNTLLHWLTLH